MDEWASANGQGPIADSRWPMAQGMGGMGAMGMMVGRVNSEKGAGVMRNDLVTSAATEGNRYDFDSETGGESLVFAGWAAIPRDREEGWVGESASDAGRCAEGVGFAECDECAWGAGEAGARCLED